MLPYPPTKPITLPLQRGFSVAGKKEYAKPPTKGRGVSYGCNSGSPLTDDVGTKTHPPLEQYIA